MDIKNRHNKGLRDDFLILMPFYRKKQLFREDYRAYLLFSILAQKITFCSVSLHSRKVTCVFIRKGERSKKREKHQ